MSEIGGMELGHILQFKIEHCRQYSEHLRWLRSDPARFPLAGEDTLLERPQACHRYLSVELDTLVSSHTNILRQKVTHRSFVPSYQSR